MNLKKIVASALMTSFAFGTIVTPVSANESNTVTPQNAPKSTLEVVNIEANTRVGDGGKEVTSFDITVNDGSLLADVKAEDFDIQNQISVIPIDLNGNMASPYTEDGVSVEVNENVLTIEMTPFNYNGTYNGAGWSVVSDNYPALNFDASDVDVVHTQTLDNVQRGTFTYAGLEREYALYMPENASGPVPLVVWNHGGGEYGIDIEKTLIANRGVTAWPEAGYETAVLMIQVSNPNYSYGAAKDPEKQKLIDQNNALQAALIKQLIAEGKVDENRVYVTGASSGGGATMRFLMQYPELFAGAIACCSMDPIVTVHKQSGGFSDYDQLVKDFASAFQGNVYTWDEATGAMVEKKVDTETLINVPIYFTHAENDGTCQVYSSKAMYDALASLGDTNNQITIWSDEEMAADGIGNGLGGALLHWSWVKVLNHNEAGSPMNWLFQQSLETAPVETTEVSFDLHAHVFDYGEAIDSVQIDLSKVLGDKSIDAEALSADMFTVKATATDPYGLDEELGYKDVERKITNVSVKDGIVTLTLECSYNGAGQGTLNYSMTASRNLSADISYEITLNKDIPLTNGEKLAADAFHLTQNEIKNEETAAFTPGTSNGLNYQLYIPENANDGNDHPLIIWFHGNGEGGYENAQNNNSQLRANRGALGFTTEEAQEIFGGAYVLAPQAPDTWYNNYSKGYIEDATAMINEIADTYAVDKDRIYVYGCSAGGYMTIRMAIENPKLFAAVVPTCPAIDVAKDRGGVETTDEEILSLSNQNIWLVQAKNDTTVLEPDCAGRIAKLLPNAIYTPYETVNVDNVEYPGHWSWIYTARNMPSYNGLSLFEWTAKQTLADTTGTTDDVVQTLDNQMIYPYVGLMLFAVLGMGGYVIYRKKEQLNTK